MVELRCPACNKVLKPKGMALHVRKCPKWSEVIGVPPSEFNFDKHFGRGLYADGLEEGVHYVQCKVCLGEGKDLRFKRMMDHLKKVHRLDEAGYTARFPGALVRLSSTARKRRETVRERYGVDNVFQDEGVKAKSRESMLERHGVEHNRHDSESERKRAETNLARYGAENPFGSPEVQERIRQTHLRERGVENPNQDPAVMAKRVETNRERYGADHFLQTDEFKAKFRGTNLARFGAPHPMQSEDGTRRFREGYESRHGYPSPMHDPDVQRRMYESNLRNHGGRHSQQCPEVLAKARATWLEKYGVDNPSKAEVVKARIKEVWEGKYGVPFPPQSLWVNQEQSFPNKIEQQVDELSPAQVIYAGDGSYWIRHKGGSKARNPDFVVLKPEQLEAYRGGMDLNSLRTSAVIEVFGDYWHGPEKTGASRGAHKHAVETFYGRAGIVCLVLWESEIKKNPKRVATRIQVFLRRWVEGAYREERALADRDILSLFPPL